jgi:hypothetical protein
MGGLGMLYSQGITTKVISDELKNKEELMKDVDVSYAKFKSTVTQKEKKIKTFSQEKIEPVSEQA